MDYTEKKLRRLNTYEGIIINVGLDRVSLPDGSEAFREIVEHPGGACILPVDGEGNAYCVRQYRYPIGEHLLEAPAGKLERGEDPLVCAVRELGEETGFTAGRIVPLGAYHSSPGFSSERLYLYLASNADNYLLALSPLALERDVGMPRSTFYDQFRKLVNCGYLVQTGGNQYDFYEVPQSDTQTKTADRQDSPTDKPKNPADDIEINNINNKNSIINTVQGQQVVPASDKFIF